MSVDLSSAGIIANVPQTLYLAVSQQVTGSMSMLIPLNFPVDSLLRVSLTIDSFDGAFSGPGIAEVTENTNSNNYIGINFQAGAVYSAQGLMLLKANKLMAFSVNISADAIYKYSIAIEQM